MDVLKVSRLALPLSPDQTNISQETVESIILNPDLAPLLAIVKAARNGAVYGAKVRFPHALVMVFMFRSGTLKEKLRLVFKATRQHARNLAFFATVYKSSMLILRLLNPSAPGKEGPYDTFFAGLVGGYVVFGRGKQARSSVNQQIVIYVFARVVLALAKLSIEPPSATSSTPTPTLFTQRLSPELKAKIEHNAWPVFASLSWAFVMYIFRWQPESIQSSLRSSMKYMYVGSPGT
ncbi:Peroxisomal membrane protein 4 [Cladophialophora carrionii]|uniref:Peroxisomal membrane protein 4 n=1 Tax=Cladophialophora carrionii TaxID=86049 RepID=A0A1C1CK22_9EURO|nr:Peroxisomal membrane protein 4 [Cladophialophora carrionii]